MGRIVETVRVTPIVDIKIEKFPELREATQALLGALNILHQLQDRSSELREMAVKVITNAFLLFRRRGITSEFFNINSLPPDFPILSLSTLFTVLAEGLESLSARDLEPESLTYSRTQDIDSLFLLNDQLVEGEYLKITRQVCRLFLTHQASNVSDNLLNAAQANGVSLPVLFRAIALHINQEIQNYAPYNQQVYAFMQSSAVSEGKSLLRLPPFQEREKFAHAYIGTVARARAGKNLIAEILQKDYAFKSQSLSTILKWMLQATEVLPPYSREQLIEGGKRIKSELGGGTLIEGFEQTFVTPGEPQLFLFDGLRNLEEWKTIEKLAHSWGGHAVLISLETDSYEGLSAEEALELDQRTRFSRALQAGETKDPTDANQFEDWKRVDDKERVLIDETARYATHRIFNRNGEKDKAIAQLEEILLGLSLARN